MSSDLRMRRPTMMWQEHALPGQLAAEGYKLNVAHEPGAMYATVHRHGQVLGHVEMRNWQPTEEWKDGGPHRHGLRDAVLRIMEGHAHGEPVKDEWSEPSRGGFTLEKAEPRPPPQPGFHAQPQGSHITTPHPHYGAAAAAKPKGAQQAQGGKNIWARAHHEPSNAGRTLMVQFSSDLLQGGRQKDSSDAYYDNLYSKRAGYHRPDDWWEVPQWQAHLAHSMPDADHYTVRDPEEAAKFFREAGYKNIAFSSLDVTAPFIKKLAASAPDQKFVVGGYTDMGMYKEHPNVQVHPSVQSFVESEGREYKPGYDYRHFHGVKVIPRLTLSDGCRHNCTFCCVPKKVVEKPMAEVEQQADAFGDHLDSDLVYLNDKTFGQAENHAQLPALYQRIKAKNPKFQGFIIQTTAAQMRKFTPEFLRNAGIRHVELGIESVNDPILRAHKKPANEALIEEAAQKIRQAGSSLIPNIMVGLPGEDEGTYGRTMEWLKRNQDIISHVNTYNLALYQDSELGKKLNAVSAADRDENQRVKSWMTDPEVHKRFSEKLFQFANEQLDRQPNAPTAQQLTQPLTKADLPTDVDPEVAHLVKPAAKQPIPVKTQYAPEPDPENYIVFRSPVGYHVLSPEGNEQWFDTEQLRDKYLAWHQTLRQRPAGVKLLKSADLDSVYARAVATRKQFGIKSSAWIHPRTGEVVPGSGYVHDLDVLENHPDRDVEWQRGYILNDGTAVDAGAFDRDLWNGTGRFAKDEMDPNPPRAASVLCHNEDGLVLWGRRQKDGKWTLPGGHLEPGESPAEGAARELWEEAGITPSTLSHFGTANSPSGMPVFMFHAVAFDQQPHSYSDPDHEVAEWRWVDCLNGVPPEIRQNLAHPRNVIVEHMGW